MSDDLGGHNRHSEAETAGPMGSGDPASPGSPTAGRDEETVTLDPSSVRAEIGLSAGETVGPFRLLEVIGVGGFGVVWLAEQREPIRRRVALKVIKPGMDSAAVVARFEAERNALSVMDHPNIARVLDGGTTGRGLPYFVMEHVPGEPLTEYCRRRKLGLGARLEVFGQVCQAVQHAHTKGVVHRDLKPSNILVREVDNAPVAKVIDFGVAKALDQRLSEHTVFTARGHMLGTPEYMAPEQAEASGRDIDTRADVYSLGVVLYELLTGARPFDFRELAYHEVVRVLAEVEPPRPSTRVIAALAETRDADPASAVETRTIARALKNDLDWVVMKALEKDRGRRYQAASALGDDVRRVLASEPVEASPPSISYRFTRFVRRHRVPIAVSAAVAVLAGVSAVVSAVGWARALGNERAARQTLIGIVREALRQEWASGELMGYAEAAGINLQLSEEGDDRRFLIEFEGGDEVPRLAAFAEQLFLWSSESADAAALTAEQQSQLRAFVFDEIVEAARPGRLGPDATVIDAVLAAVPKLKGYGLDAAADAGLRAQLAVVLYDAGFDRASAALATEADGLFPDATLEAPVPLFNRLTLAAALSRSGDAVAADETYATLVGDGAALFGPDHPFVLSVMATWAVNDMARGDFAAAVDRLEPLPHAFEATDGVNSEGAVSTRISLGHARSVQLEFSGSSAERVLAHASEMEALYGSVLRSPFRASYAPLAASVACRAMLNADRYDDAIKLAGYALAGLTDTMAEEASVRVALAHHRGRALAASGRTDSGLSDLRWALAKHRVRVGSDAPVSRLEVIMHARYVETLLDAGPSHETEAERASIVFAALMPLEVLIATDPAVGYVSDLLDRIRAAGFLSRLRDPSRSPSRTRA